MKINPDKHHLLLNSLDQKEMKICMKTVKSSDSEKLVRTKFDRKLMLNHQIEEL